MKVYSRDRVECGKLNYNKKQYQICTMTLFGKGDIETAKEEATDSQGNLSFTHIEVDGRTYALFNETVIAQGTVYVNIEGEADPRAYFFSDDDAGTDDEWQGIS